MHAKIISVPVGRTTPAECVCPSCRRFEREAGAELCPRCTLIRSNRVSDSDRTGQHHELATRERAPTLLAQIEEWDPDWRDHYGTIESAECNYARAMERSEAARHLLLDRGVES